jgi:hypothetical protein
MKKGWLLFVGIAWLFSCLDEPDCLRSASTTLVIQFKDIFTGLKDTVVFYRVEAVGSDSVFYQQFPEDKLDTLRQQTMLLAVDPTENQTSFTFHFPVLQRTLVVGYMPTARFISEDCGSELLLSELHVVETEFDSVVVVNPFLSQDQTVNLEIFR